MMKNIPPPKFITLPLAVCVRCNHKISFRESGTVFCLYCGFDSEKRVHNLIVRASYKRK